MSVVSYAPSDTSSFQEPEGVWDRLARLTGITKICNSENCTAQPVCIEHCVVVGDEDEVIDDTTPAVFDVIPAPSKARALTGAKPSVGEFKLQWANLQGMQEKQGVGSPEKHSVLPLTSYGQDADALRKMCLPMPAFKGLLEKAYLYQADPSDSIDVELQKHLRSLSADALNVLALRKIQAGKYEIDGRHVQIYTKDGKHFLVHEDEVGHDDLPLRAYINMVANVAMSLRRIGISPSFAETGSPTIKTLKEDSDERYRAMRIACTQAELRESSQYYSSLS